MIVRKVWSILSLLTISISRRLNVYRHTNGYRINLYCSSSFLLSDLTILIIIPYGTNSLYMSVYFLSVFFYIFRLSFSFELRPLIEEIDDHWLILYVFYNTFLFSPAWNIIGTLKTKKKMSACVIFKKSLIFQLTRRNRFLTFKS